MLMRREQILEKLKEILLSADAGTSIDDITEQTALLAGLGLSSVNMLYLMIATEEEFGVRFDDVGMNDLQTVGDVITVIEGKLS